MRCDRGRAQLVFSRSRVGVAPSRQMTVRSETATRALASTANDGTLVSQLGARDRLLDAMALSKGRFAIEVQGTTTLYLPSWAEVTRVIEDCR